jgi:hypothetical protein
LHWNHNTYSYPAERSIAPAWNSRMFQISTHHVRLRQSIRSKVNYIFNEDLKDLWQIILFAILVLFLGLFSLIQNPDLSLSLSLSQDIWVFWQPSARWWWQSVRISQLCNTNDGAAQPSSENGPKSPLLLPKAAYGVNLVAGSRAGGSSPNNWITSLTSFPCYLFNYFRTYFDCKCSVNCLF